jgi:hypothetical protein
MLYNSTELQFKTGPSILMKEISVRARWAAIEGLVLNQVIFGQNASDGSTLQTDTAATAIPATPFQITPAIPGGGSFVQDLGVVSSTTGLPYVLVTGTPTTGQYAQAAGIYTFAAADEAAVVVIRFLYSSTSGRNIVIGNEFRQNAPTFRAVLNGRYNDKQMTMVLNKCVTERFALPTTLESFAIQEFDFQAIADDSGVVGTISTSQ